MGVRLHRRHLPKIKDTETFILHLKEIYLKVRESPVLLFTLFIQLCEFRAGMIRKYFDYIHSQVTLLIRTAS